MAERRNSERHLIPSDGVERIHASGAAVPENEVTEETQPLRLSFLALLADRDPAVQARLERRRALALRDDLDAADDEEDRPTDPVVMIGR